MPRIAATDVEPVAGRQREHDGEKRTHALVPGFVAERAARSVADVLVIRLGAVQVLA